MKTVAFGPVPSRRLGRSLGINSIPPKFCPYSCVYCQLGITTNLTIARRSFYKTKEIFEQVKKKVDETIKRNEQIDYLTFVANGEPTLDVNIGNEISLLKKIAIPIAIITNSSLIWENDTKEDLLESNLISFKIDTVNEKLWKRMNRPYKDLNLNTILEGISDFVNDFRGTIISETMLIDGINYGGEFEKIAEFLKHLKRLDKAYLAIPTRPPTESWVTPAKEETINEAFQVFAEKLGGKRVEYLIGYEGNKFSFTGRVEEDLLSITSVHPMRMDAVREFLKKTNSSWAIIEKLLLEDKLVELEYAGNVYYMRKLESRNETKEHV
jgi:wyosine [tRNA(Phe)-imidazoG37] synthetase (radical SAM superfamily)